MDITTLSLAKKYTNKVAAGFSNVQVDGSNLIFTLNDGTTATMTIPTPENGSDGISVIDLSIDNDGSLLCHMSDGSTIDAGKVPTVEPEHVQADWNQNDETQPDYIKNRPFGEHIESTSLYKQTEVFSKKLYNGKEYYTTSGFIGEITYEMTPGKEYQISFNGVLRSGVVKEVAPWNNWNYAYFNIGNDFLIPAASTSWQNNNYQDTKEDFAVCGGTADVAGDTGLVIAVDALYPNGNAPDELNIEIDFSTMKTKIQKIEYKYMSFRNEESLAEIFNDTTNNIFGAYGSHTEGSHTPEYKKVYTAYEKGNAVQEIDTENNIVYFSKMNGLYSLLRYYHYNDLYVHNKNTNSYVQVRVVYENGEMANALQIDDTSVNIEDLFSVGQELANIDFYIYLKNYAEGAYSHLEGENNFTEGRTSHVEGRSNQNYGNDAHVEGSYNESHGEYNHIEGKNNYAGNGYTNHIEGSDNEILLGSAYSHVEGDSNGVYGDYAHVEGRYNRAGSYSHAEGEYTAAFNNSHAEGGVYPRTPASEYLKVGEFVITEVDTTERGDHITLYFDPSTHKTKYGYVGLPISTNTSGSLGDPEVIIIREESSYYEVTLNNKLQEYPEFNVGDTVYIYAYTTGATGLNSHVEGIGTSTISEFQHVQGKYNQIDTEDKYAHIIGGGYDSNSRRNIHTVDWDGNATYTGKVTVGVAPINDMDVATKQYVDDAISSAITDALGGNY